MYRAACTALLLSAAATIAHPAAPQALVVEANWTRFDQRTDLRYWHLGTQTRIESTDTDKPDPYLLIDTAQDQRLTVYRHNSSWRCDPLEPTPRATPGMPGRPTAPQPPPGIGPQGTIGPRDLPDAGRPGMPGKPQMPTMPPPPTGIRPQPQTSVTPGAPAPQAGIGPQGTLGPRSGAGAAAMPGIPVQPGMPIRPEMPPMPAGVGPQSGVGPGAMPPMPGAGMGVGMGGGMPMPGREQAPSLTKTEESQTLLGRTAVKYTLAGRMMETVEIWAVPDADFGPFFAYRPHPPHRFGPVDLQDQWDALVRREGLFPLLAIFKQGEREIGRFTVTKLDTREVAEPAAFFAPPPAYYKSPPDPF
jgi:hypothetical protein